MEALPDERFDISDFYTKRLNSGFYTKHFIVNGEEPVHKQALRFVSECGTAACIAGWSFVINSGAIQGQDEILGLSTERGVMSCLCLTRFISSPSNFPRARAIRVIDHFLETGIMSWETKSMSDIGKGDWVEAINNPSPKYGFSPGSIYQVSEVTTALGCFCKRACNNQGLRFINGPDAGQFNARAWCIL